MKGDIVAVLVFSVLAAAMRHPNACGASSEQNPFDSLGKVVETWYDVEAQDVRRYMLGGAGRVPRWRRPTQGEPGQRPAQPPAAKPGSKALPITLWIDKAGTVKKFKHHGAKGKADAVIQPVKHHGKWGIKQLDLTQYDDEGRFDKRTLLTITHTYPKNVMLPSKITIRDLDKFGKLLKRRNEVNPLTLTFRKYELEMR